MVTPRVTLGTVVFWLARALADSRIAPFDEVAWLTILTSVLSWIALNIYKSVLERQRIELGVEIEVMFLWVLKRIGIIY